MLIFYIASFPFNNDQFLQSHSHPEAARKARDSGLLNSLSNLNDGGITPESTPARPMSTIDNADWSFAQREATIHSRFPNGDLEVSKLGNNELDRLYAEILKVRSSRTASSMGGDDQNRSESQMSLIDSLDATDEEGEEESEWNGGASPRRRMFSASSAWSAPDTGEKIRPIIDEYEERIKGVLHSAGTVIDGKVAFLESTMKKTSLDLCLPIIPAMWSTLSEGEALLARKVVEKWKKRRRVGMAAIALIAARDLKEANVMSMELKKSVTMQFVIIEEEIPSESISPSIFDSASSITPQLGVKVLDKRKPRTVQLWSMSKFRLQLTKMRNLCVE